MMDDNKEKKDKTGNTGDTGDKFDQIFDENFDDSQDKDKKDENSEDVLILDDSFKSVEEDEFAGDLFGPEGDATAISEISWEKDKERKAQKTGESGIDIYQEERRQESSEKDEEIMEIGGEQLYDDLEEPDEPRSVDLERKGYKGAEEDVIELDFPGETSEADFKDLEGLFEEESSERDQEIDETHDLVQHNIEAPGEPVFEEPVPPKDSGEFFETEISSNAEELDFPEDSFGEDIEDSPDEIPEIINDLNYEGGVDSLSSRELENLDKNDGMDGSLKPDDELQDDGLGGFIMENHRSLEGNAPPPPPEPEDKMIESEGDIENLVREKRPAVPTAMPEEEVDIHNLEPVSRAPESPAEVERKSFRLDEGEPKKSFMNIDENTIEKLKIPGIIAGIIAVIAIVYFVVFKGNGEETPQINENSSRLAKIEQWKKNRLKQQNQKKPVQTVTGDQKISPEVQDKGKASDSQKDSKSTVKKSPNDEAAKKTKTSPVTGKTTAMPDSQKIEDQKKKKPDKQDEEALFEKIQQEDTLEGYRNYIRQHPEGKFRRDALIRIRFLENKQEQNIAQEIISKAKQYQQKNYRYRFKQFEKNQLADILNKVRGHAARIEKTNIKGQNVIVDYTSGLMWHLWENPVDQNRVNIWKARRYAGYMDWDVPTAEQALTLSHRELESLLESKPETYQIWTGDSNATPTGAENILCVDLKTKKLSFVSNKSFNYLFCCRRVLR